MTTFHLTYTDHEGDTSYAINQGCTFDSLVILSEEDYSGWTARGQIRDKYRQDGGVILANFEFNNPLVFAPETIEGVTKNYTKIRPILSASVTDSLNFNLKVRSDLGVDAVPGKNVWIYDIQVVSANGLTVYPIVNGWVEIFKEVTQP